MRDRDGGKREVKAENTSAVNLSELSQEERMAYYKQKYDKSGNQQAAGGDGSRRDKTGRRNQHRGRNRQPGAESAGRTRSETSDTTKPADQGTTKKGLLSRLFDVFRKK